VTLARSCRSLGTVMCNLSARSAGHIQHLPFGVLIIGLPNECFHFNQINHALEIIFRSGSESAQATVGSLSAFDHIDATQEIRAAAIHFIDIANSRDAVVVGQPPIRFRLRLDTRHTVDTTTAPSSTRSERFTSMVEIHVSRRVDQVDFLIAPKGGLPRRFEW